jgi:hypothetical protein
MTTTCTCIAPAAIEMRGIAHILECIWMRYGSHQTACGAQEFGRFGVVQSVNICRKPSLVASEQYWR